MFVAATALVAGAAGDKQKSDLDRPNDFLAKVATYDHAMVEYGKLAENRGASSSVRAFASDLVQDHQRGLKNLAEMLKDRKVAIVTGTEKETRDEASRLGKLEGKTFDDAFLKRVIDDHDWAIRVFEAQAKGSDAPDVRKFATDRLPNIRAHRTKAQELSKASK